MSPSSATPAFEPWIGADYEENGFQGIRVLLLGESHFVGEGDPGPTITQNVVRKYGIEGRSQPFFTKVWKTMSPDGGDSSEDREAFWHSVAFYNFIQEPVGEVARQKSPTPEMWQRAVEPFRSVIADLEPQAIVVLGKRLWRHLPQPDKATTKTVDDDESLTIRVYEEKGHRALAGHVTHPAGSISYETARPRIRALLKAAHEQA